jgi:hypothetical protein
MDEDRFITQIVSAYVKYKREERLEMLKSNSMSEVNQIPIVLSMRCSDDLLFIHQHLCALDFKRMSHDLKGELTSLDVIDDLATTFWHLDRKNLTLNYTPKYAIVRKAKNPVGRPKAQSVELFRERYKPENKIYTLGELAGIDEKHIWTIERRPLRNPKRDKLYILPGIRYNNLEKQWEVVGYIKTENERISAKEQYMWNQINGEVK